MAVDRSTPPPITDFKEIRLDVPAPITLSNGIKMWVPGNGEAEINKISLSITGGAFRNSHNLLGRKREMEETGRQIEQMKKLRAEKQEAIAELEKAEQSFDATLRLLKQVAKK